jgi:chromosome partitioning protein
LVTSITQAYLYAAVIRLISFIRITKEILKLKTICIVNHKGGVGKTTSVANIGAGLALAGAKVLLIDIDAQCNLSESFGLVRQVPNIYTSITQRTPLPIYSVKPNLDVVPSSLELVKAEIEISAAMSRESILRKLLDAVKSKYDFVLIDSPPSLGLLTVNALTAADEVIIPLEAEFLAYRGLDSIVFAIDLTKENTNPALKIGGVFLTKYNKSRSLTKSIREEVGKYFGDVLFETVIRVNVALAEAPSNGKDIFEYAPDSNGAADYADLVKEILKRAQSTH